MKRVIKATDDLILKRCNDYIAQIEDHLKWAEDDKAEYLKSKKSYNFKTSLMTLNSAFYRLNDFSSYINKLINANKLTPQEQEHFLSVYDELYDAINRGYDELRTLQNEAKERHKAKSKTIEWSRLTGSEQMAVEFANNFIAEGYSIEDAAYKACDQVSYGNAEVEYSGEGFYQDEPDEQKVLEYLLARERGEVR